MRGVRIAGIVLCVAVAAAALGVIVMDRNARGSVAEAGSPTGFYVQYQCVDARDEFKAGDLHYDLRLDHGQWLARTTLRLSRAGLRSPCRIDFGVPPGSRDTPGRAHQPGDRRVLLARHGSAEGTSASIEVRPPESSGAPTSQTFKFDVVLPDDPELSDSLALGLHFFRFAFFGPGEAGSFRAGRLELSLPPDHSFVEAAPQAEEGDERSRTWTLAAGRDHEVVVTYRHDTTRTAVAWAPETLLGALALALALGALPGPREPEPKPAVEPVPEAPPEPERETRPLLPAPPAVEPSRRRRYGWLALLALPVVGGILRRRFRR